MLDCVCIVFSDREPYELWHSLLESSLSKANIPHERLNLGSFISTPTLTNDKTIYIIRSNTDASKMLACQILISGGTLINGFFQTLKWPRIALFSLASSLPNNNHLLMWTNNPSSAYNTGCYNERMLIKRMCFQGGLPILIEGEQQFLDYCRYWHDNDQDSGIEYFERFVDNAISIKVYLIGNKIFSFKTSSSYMDKIPRDKERLDLPDHIKQKILTIAESHGIQFCSLDIMRNEHDAYFIVDLNFFTSLSLELGLYDHVATLLGNMLRKEA